MIVLTRIFLANGFLVAAWSSVSAFQFQYGGGMVAPPLNSATTTKRERLGPLFSSLAGSTMGGTIDLQETAQRDVYTVQEWARQYGAQTADGFELTSQDGGQDWNVMTNQFVPAGTPILFIPAAIVISSGAVEAEFGGSLFQAETALTQYDQGTAQRLPLFRLMIKILAEYEKGSQSPYFPWLNSLPRLFYNGVAMTDACFECLPPYAAWLSMQERNNFSKFINALRKGYLPLSQETLANDQLVKWAYNVALTRFDEVWEPTREKKLTPLADMFNHGTNPNVVITYDGEGNCLATTTQDVQAGSPLTVSLGDPTNPTPLFAKYGFLYNDCATLFCKAMHLKDKIDLLGYDFRDLLFSVQTGDIAPKVWDIFLMKILENDPANADGFMVACKTKDEATKQAYHQQYFQYTLQALRDHVNAILSDVDRLNMKANSYDLTKHPRVPVIVAHNDLVRACFMQVKAQLDAMG